MASAILGHQKDPEPMRVVLLAGFLGAGKTTVLEHLLRAQHECRLGIIVNDLASVNVDARVLRESIDSAGVQSITLENGCVCCTASDDLRESVRSMLDGPNSSSLDAIVVELSGVGEPARVKDFLEQLSEPGEGGAPLLSIRTATVIDTPAFASDYMGEQSGQDAPHSASRERDNRYGALLAEQVEGADLVLLNKADIATEQELVQTRAMVGALNKFAETCVTQYGKVDVRELLTIESRRGHASLEQQRVPEIEPPKSSCCAAKMCSSSNSDSTATCTSSSSNKAETRAESRFGITSFVYTAERMTSRAKLVRELGKWQSARAACGDRLSLEGLGANVTKPSASKEQIDSPFSPILRSKGFLLLDAQPEAAFYWSHAGKSASFSMLGPWPEATAQRTELVFIGAKYDEDEIRKVLDSCLETEKDRAFRERISGR